LTNRRKRIRDFSEYADARKFWISALSTSLSWMVGDEECIRARKTGEDLTGVMSRVISQQMGSEVKL